MLDQQRTELAMDEGTRTLVYDDATGRPIGPGSVLKGHPTVGTGRALDVHGLTQDEAALLFTNDILRVESALGLLPWYEGLDPVRKGVVVNLAVNLGMHGLLGFTNMIADLSIAQHDLAGSLYAAATADFDRAASELLASRWARQVQPARRDRLVRQLRTGLLDVETRPVTG